MAMESYEEATALIVIINQVLMLRNFADPRKNKCKYICSWVCIVSFVTLFFMCLLIGEIFFLQMVTLNIQILLYVFTMAVITYGYLIIVSVNLYNSKAALRLTAQINNVDEALKKLGAKIEYRNLFHRVIVTVSFWTLLSIATVLGTQISLQQQLHGVQLAVNFCYVYIMYTGSIVLFEFYIIVHWLGLKFEQTNELLATFLLEDGQSNAENRNAKITVQPAPNFCDKVQLCGGLSKNVHVLEQIRLVHLRLCSVSKMLNRMFQRQILIFVFMTLNYMLVAFYNMYLKIKKWDQFSVSLNGLLLFFIDATYNFIKLVLVSYNCERTTNRANKAIDMIHACPLYDVDPDLKDEIVQFCLQMSYMQPGKSKSASLWLNYCFIHQCAAYVLTNLILMIQWSDDMIKQDWVTVKNETEYAVVKTQCRGNSEMRKRVLASFNYANQPILQSDIDHSRRQERVING
ncbi:unnamed protein product [Xylocopa violacea]|uniref:Gustatory receptor n=1 Tax=Xylocopa violacea TaxID=135666 RepID=A0ABP1NF04_XYLVO